jgi:murein DD-endopeptidase MepM/ murein hydrolase activator NlpD
VALESVVARISDTTRPQSARGLGRVGGTVTVAAAAVMAAIGTWAAAPAAADTWRWPVRGDVVTDFAAAGGPYAAGQHRGIDVAAAVGEPVVAATDGVVRFSGMAGTSGLTVSVRTRDGRYDTSYLHLAAATVRAGEAVTAGTRLGVVGTSGSGSAAAPHLHFGVRDAGTRRYRDPLGLLPPRPGGRELPRGVPVPLSGPLRAGPRSAPVRRAPRVGRNPLAWDARQPVAAADAPGPLGWAIACGALICAAILLGPGSSIDARVVLRHHADLLRQR